MAKNKTTTTDADVQQFIDGFADTDQKKKDSYALLSLMEKTSGYPPKMWAPSIIGFGAYHYRYDSGHEGDAPLIGFSPRKAAISLYVYAGNEADKQLLDGLGKFKMGKACIYINKLSDIDEKQLVKLMRATISSLRKKYPQ